MQGASPVTLLAGYNGSAYSHSAYVNFTVPSSNGRTFYTWAFAGGPPFDWPSLPAGLSVESSYNESASCCSQMGIASGVLPVGAYQTSIVDTGSTGNPISVAVYFVASASSYSFVNRTSAEAMSYSLPGGAVAYIGLLTSGGLYSVNSPSLSSIDEASNAVNGGTTALIGRQSSGLFSFTTSAGSYGIGAIGIYGSGSSSGPSISSVAFSGSSGSYTLNIDGQGFGSSTVSLPYTGDVGNFRIGDWAQIGYGEWGYSGDANTLTYTSWSDTTIQVSGFGGSPGDAITIAVWNSVSGLGATWGGDVPGGPSSPTISSVTFSGSGSSTTIQVQGSGFGSAPTTMPYSGVLNDFIFWDGRSPCGGGSSQFEAGGARWGHGSDSVSLNYQSWSDSSISIGGFGSGYGSGCAIFDTGDPVSVVVWNSADSSQTGPQTSWGGFAGGSTSSTTVNTDWIPAEDAYNIGNPGSPWQAGGNCYGLSSTALLYFEHYALGESGMPRYPDVSQYYPNPLPNTADYPLTSSTWSVLDNFTLAIYLHQSQQAGVYWGPLWGSNSQSATEITTSLKEGQPVAVAINGPNFHGESIAHSVIFYGATLYANGTDEFYVSDPNEGDASITTYAWFYSDGTFTYTNGNGNPGVTWNEFQPQATPLISLSWLHWPPWQPWDINTIAGGWEVVLASTAVSVSTTGGGTTQTDNFTDSDRGNSETFSQGIPGTSGIEEGNTQAYGIPPGVSVSVKDPSTEASTMRIEWGTNESGQLTGYAVQVDTSSGGQNDYSLERTPSGFSTMTRSAPITFNLSLIGSTLPHWDALNASSLRLGAYETALFKVSSWTALNETTTSSVTVVVTNTTTGKVLGNYTLVNGQTGFSPAKPPPTFLGLPGFEGYILIGMVVAVAIAAVVFVLRGHGKRLAHVSPSKEELESKESETKD